MKTIRRLYFYLVALISLEVVLWGLINLLRTIFSSELTFPGADTLAQALALIFVGVPIFLTHWLWAQNISAKDMEENSATLRALFFYAALLITLIPVIQNLLAFINRTLVISVGIDTSRAFLGGSQTWIDNIIAIILNLLAAAYLYSVLGKNWKSLTETENFADIRRLYRYIWVLYGLMMLVYGVQQVIRFLFYQPANVLGIPNREMFINGSALILIGAPVWVFAWNLCQKSIDDEQEKGSILRLGVLYLLALVGVSVVLSMTGLTINLVLEQLLGANTSWQELVSKIGDRVSVGLPLGLVWAYYGHWLGQEFSATGDPLRRAALKRFYYYILSLIGVVSSFVGLALLFSFVVSSLSSEVLWGDILRARLSAAISTLLAGMPLWLATWMPLQKEAISAGDQGDHARRSILRRAYLYLAIFTTVIGGMVTAIYLVYTVLFGLLDHRSSSFLTDVLNGVQLLVLFVAFLLYHWTVMRKDGDRAADALVEKQARFAVLILENEGSGFSGPLVDAIKRASSFIPVATQAVEHGIPEGAGSVQVVVLPSNLALDPPEALRLWLKEYTGRKIIVPVPLNGWLWTGGMAKNNPAATAQIIRNLAEGQEVRISSGSSAWQMTAYVFAALFLFQILFVFFGLGISLISGD